MKKTIILTLAALMSISASYAAVTSDNMTETTVLTDSKPAKKKGELKSVTFKVHLHCENCVKKVQENIAFEKGVKDLKVSLEDQTVAIKYDAAKTSEETLEAAIVKLGYPVSGKLMPGEEHVHERTAGEHQHHHVRTH